MQTQIVDISSGDTLGDIFTLACNQGIAFPLNYFLCRLSYQAYIYHISGNSLDIHMCLKHCQKCLISPISKKKSMSIADGVCPQNESKHMEYLSGSNEKTCLTQHYELLIITVNMTIDVYYFRVDPLVFASTPDFRNKSTHNLQYVIKVSNGT